jgi:DNA-binding PucR family transcriptional regulator
MPTIPWQPPAPTVQVHIREIAERMAEESDALVDEIMEAIFAASPELADDPVLAARTRASTAANARRWIAATADEPDRPVSIDAPPEALDLARDFARRGMDRDALFTSYRTGQNVAWTRAMRAAREAGLDGEELVAVLDVLSRSMFGFVDGVLSVVIRQIERERGDLVSGALTRQLETTNLILDGAPITEQAASSRLGHELAREHTALVLWGEPGGMEQGELEEAAAAVARRLDAGRPFSVPSGTSALWAWISGPAPHPDELTAALEAVPATLRAAIGTAHPGIEGFRASHAEALAVQRLLMRQAGGPRSASYADVEVVSLASQDEQRAAAFIAATLGELAGADEQLRETVRVYLQQDCSTARAAELLHTHRNTVLKRLARADTLLPSSLAGRGLEVRLALELMRWGTRAQAAET